jgi:hypothetical protein
MKPRKEGGIGILGRSRCQMSIHRISSDVVMKTHESIRVKKSYLGKPALPHGRFESDLSSCPKSESAFDELNGTLNTDFRSECNQQVKVVGHDNKVMKQVFVLQAVVVQHFNKQSSGAFGLQQTSLSRGGRGHKECTFARGEVRWIGMAERDSHRQGLKPEIHFATGSARLKPYPVTKLEHYEPVVCDGGTMHL